MGDHLDNTSEDSSNEQSPSDIISRQNGLWDDVTLVPFNANHELLVLVRDVPNDGMHSTT